jgi:hypothetical protein
MKTMRPVSFELHIRPLFRDDPDIDHMTGFFDLRMHADVKANAQPILTRLKHPGKRMMPPPADGGPWPEEWIALFERWIAEGCQP